MYQQQNFALQSEIEMKEENHLIAESCHLADTLLQGIHWEWIWLVLAGIGMLDFALWIFVILRFKKRHTKKIIGREIKS